MMQTEMLRADRPDEMARAARFIREGQAVVFPTDTLYGIGVDAFQQEAVGHLYVVKGRSAAKGIPVLLSDKEFLERVAVDIPPLATALIARFWPGPLTLIVPRHPLLPGNLSPNANVAVRMPSNEIGRRFIRLAGGALATSSANRSGAPAATTAADAYQQFAGRIPAVLDGGAVIYEQPSTIVDCTVEPARILRAGPLSAEELSL